MTRRLFLASPILLAACVAPQKVAPPPVATPRPTTAPAPAPPPPVGWQDRAYTPGDWSYTRSGQTRQASYGASAPLVSLICEASSGQIQLLLPGAAAGPVTVRTTDGDVARAAQATSAGVMLTLPASDPMLDRIAYSRGRFMLAAGGQELILPTWPEVARVVEDCRS